MYNSDKRILHLIALLIYQKEIKSIRGFCVKTEILEPTISKIKNGKAHFTAQQIAKICEVFNVNANWIFETEIKVFRTPDSIEIKDI